MSTFENGLMRMFATGRPGCLGELCSWCLERGVEYVSELRACKDKEMISQNSWLSI